MPAGLQRQNRSGDELGRLVAQDSHPRTRSEPRGERAHRDQLQPPVVFESTDHGADRVGVNHDRAVDRGRLPRQLRDQGTPPRQCERNAQIVEHLADELHHRIGASRGARCLQQRQQGVDHPGAFGVRHRGRLAHGVPFDRGRPGGAARGVVRARKPMRSSLVQGSIPPPYGHLNGQLEAHVVVCCSVRRSDPPGGWGVSGGVPTRMRA